MLFFLRVENCIGLGLTKNSGQEHDKKSRAGRIQAA
jgi:hypothetical protein